MRIAVVGVLVLLLLMAAVVFMSADVQAQVSTLAVQSVPTVQPTPTEDATVTALTKKQLTQQVAQQQHTWDDWLWSNAAAILSSFLSTLVIVVGALLGFRQWRVNRDDTLATASRDRQDAQDNDLKDRKDEREKRAEERFQAVVEGLGSERTEAKVGAVITLRTFLQPGYEQFYRQAFDLAVAHLRLRKADASALGSPSSLDQVLIVPKGPLLQKQQLPPPIPLNSLSQALITVFKESFPLAREGLQKLNVRFDPQLLDATGVQLDNAYLAGADLKQIWGPQASLRRANLIRADLSGANLFEADFSGADLSDANLTRACLFEATLSGATLDGADLSGAYLFKADFSGADLSDANLSRAYLFEVTLSGATLDGAALTRAKLTGTKGLTDEQRAAYKAQGALVDEEPVSNVSQEPVSTSPPLELERVQSPSPQETSPAPDASRGDGMSSQAVLDKRTSGEIEKGDDVGRTPEKHRERDDRPSGE